MDVDLASCLYGSLKSFSWYLVDGASGDWFVGGARPLLISPDPPLEWVDENTQSNSW